MIVVTAPTGNIGHRVVEHLLEAGEKIRVIVRDPAKLDKSVRNRVEAIQGSHSDPSVVNSAFAGADAVFWLVPPNPRLTLQQAYVDFTRPAIEAIRRQGVSHVVAVTALGRGTAWATRAGLVSASIAMDDLLMTSGVAFRGLAMPGFMDNVLQQADAIKTKGMLFGPIDADRKIPATATRDMGAIAARLLKDRSWTGQAEIAVLGPEQLSMNDMAKIISDVLGRRVSYQQVPFEAFKNQLLSRGMSEDFAQGYVDMMRAKNEGMDNAASPPSRSAAPTTFRQWCEDALKPALTA